MVQFERNEVWELGTKFPKLIFNNKSYENGVVTKNKVCHVAHGYTHINEVDFDEPFAPATKLKAIRLLLRLSCFPKFKLYQMNVKSVFLNEYLNEEVYAGKPT